VIELSANPTGVHSGSAAPSGEAVQFGGGLGGGSGGGAGGDLGTKDGAALLGMALCTQVVATLPTRGAMVRAAAVWVALVAVVVVWVVPTTVSA
jgi:hypothetical protein